MVEKTVLKSAIKVLLAAASIAISTELAYECAKQILENSISFETAVSIKTFIEGTGSSEAVEALRDYLWLVRSMVTFITAYSAILIMHSIYRPAIDVGEYQKKPLQRFYRLIMTKIIKTLCFALIFWGSFRVLPYEYFTSDTHKLDMSWLLTFCIINLALTAAIYKCGFALWNKSSR